MSRPFLSNVFSSLELTDVCNDYIIRRFAGVFLLLSIAFGWWVHPAWFLFTAFVGANLLQSSFTGFCPLERILSAVGFPGCQRAR
jgi:hypothetical protein